MYFSVDSIDGEENSSKFYENEGSEGSIKPNSGQLDEVEQAAAIDGRCSSPIDQSDSLSKANSTGDQDRRPSRQESEVSLLSPWEKWVIKKAHEERTKREDEHRLKREKQKVTKIQRKSQAEKLKRSDKAYQQWLTDKTERQKDSEYKRKNILTDNAKLAIERREAVEARSKASYEEWCAKKKRKRKENERLQAEAQAHQAEAEQKKRERGDRAYTAWMKVNSRRHLEIDWYGRLEGQSSH